MRFRQFGLLLSTLLLCLSGLVSSARAAILFISSNTTNEVYRYQVQPVGAPTLDLILTANLNSPYGVEISPWGELFVTNRFTPAHFGGQAGTIARFLNPTGSAVPNGVLADSNTNDGFDFRNPHGLEFRSSELFVVNNANNLLRFTFDGSGQAVANGTISDHLTNLAGRGIDFNAAGDLFVSEANSSVPLNQWTFDGSGNSVFVREFSTLGSNHHGIVFSPWGEMFVAAANSHSISRIVFDGSGNPVSNGQITGNGLNGPVELTFSTWGELFVGNHGAAAVSRFTFDGAHNAIANGTFSTPQGVAGLVFAADIAAVPEPSALALWSIGALCLVGWRRLRQRK